LGVHEVMVDSTSTPAASATTTISENSTSAQAAVWMWSGGGWGSPATSKVTQTNSSGYISQPGSDGAIRIREYKKESATTTYYKYNLQISASGFSDYNYYSDQGTKYIASVSSTDENVDTCISESWQRNDIDVNNSEPSINQPPTTGTWYVGLSSDLVFGLDSLTVDFDTLDAGNNFTDTASTTLYVTTTAPQGYIVHTYDSAGNNGALTSTSTTSTITRWDASNATPTTWGAGNYGFGYTTDDDSLSGGTLDRFTSGGPKYAGFTSSTEEVADRDQGNWYGATNVITYKVSVSSTQTPATYQTTITFICTANY